MDEIKSLKEISWQVDEETYREDKSLSYSILAKYERTGFSGLPHLFDKIETPSLTFGSAVDSIITGGIDEFNTRFIVADFPNISDSLIQIANTLYERYKNTYKSIEEIPNNILADVGKECEFYANDKYANYRVKLIKEGCSSYYELLFKSTDKKILSKQTYKEVLDAVEVLQNSETTRGYFKHTNPFDPSMEYLYQLKFKGSNKGVNYRCMADLLIVDHNTKTIYPVDLKTSSHEEYDFYKSFITWMYNIQAILYWRIIRQNLDKDPYFKDFKLANYRFIVVNKKSLTPLVWEFKSTTATVPLNFGKDRQITLRDPYTIGEELNEYIKNTPRVPNGISRINANNIEEWLNKL